MSSSSSQLPSRRRLLQAGLAVGATAAMPVRSLLAASANEQINVGLIGCGGRGTFLIGQCASVPGVNVAGLCDPDTERTDKLGETYPKAQKYTDLREMLASDDIDAVIVATCNHWHGLAAIWAMEAGKDVYVEKPLCTTQWEGQQVVETAKRTGRVCQIGTQQRSDPIQAKIKKILHEDKALGEIKWVQVNRLGMRASIGKRDTPLAPPKTVDYNLWLGPAEDKPMHRKNFHYDWHWVWNTGSGEMGNWGVHIIDDVRNNVFQDEVKTPSSVVSAGGRFQWDDAGNTPNVHFAVLDAGGIPVTISVCNISAKPGMKTSPEAQGAPSGYVVHCEGGRLEGQRGSFAVFDAAGEKVDAMRGDAGSRHMANWVAAVRAGDDSTLNGPVEEGFYSTGWCNLANIGSQMAQGDQHASLSEVVAHVDEPGVGKVYQQLAEVCSSHGGNPAEDFRLGPVLSLETASGRFTGAASEAANKHLRREYREGFALKMPVEQGAGA